MSPRNFLLPMLMLAPEMAGAEHPLRVTTDNRAYCQVLLERISAVPGSTAGAAVQLTEQGLRLCHTGHPRAGIAKLRRALRMAMAEEE